MYHEVAARRACGERGFQALDKEQHKTLPMYLDIQESCEDEAEEKSCKAKMENEETKSGVEDIEGKIESEKQL